MARAPISGFEVPAVGIEAGSGDLVLGANLEFRAPSSARRSMPRASWRCARGGAAAALGDPRRARARPARTAGRHSSEAATADARPSSTSRATGVRLDDLYPWPFRPDAPRRRGRRPGERSLADLADQAEARRRRGVAGALLEVGGARPCTVLRGPERGGRCGCATGGCSRGRRRERRLQPVHHRRPGGDGRMLAADPQPGPVVQALAGAKTPAPRSTRRPDSGRLLAARRPKPGARVGVDWSRVAEAARWSIGRAGGRRCPRRQRRISPPCGSRSGCPGSPVATRRRGRQRLDERFGAGRVAARHTSCAAGSCRRPRRSSSTRQAYRVFLTAVGRS